jgi:hypothetical protein
MIHAFDTYPPPSLLNLKSIILVLRPIWLIPIDRPKPTSAARSHGIFPTRPTPHGTLKSLLRTCPTEFHGVDALPKFNWFQNKRINALLHPPPLTGHSVIGRSQSNVVQPSSSLPLRLGKRLLQSRIALLPNLVPLSIPLVASSRNSAGSSKGEKRAL